MISLPRFLPYLCDARMFCRTQIQNLIYASPLYLFTKYRSFVLRKEHGENMAYTYTFNLLRRSQSLLLL